MLISRVKKDVVEQHMVDDSVDLRHSCHRSSWLPSSAPMVSPTTQRVRQRLFFFLVAPATQLNFATKQWATLSHREGALLSASVLGAGRDLLQNVAFPSGLLLRFETYDLAWWRVLGRRRAVLR